MIKNNNKKNNRKYNNNNNSLFNKQLKMKYKYLLLQIINLIQVLICHQKEKNNQKKNKSVKMKRHAKHKRVLEKKNNKL